MKHPLLELTSEELLQLTVQHILAANPRIQLGDRLTPYQAEKVLNGKITPATEPFPYSRNTLKLDFMVPHVERPQPHFPSTRSLKIPFNSTFEEWLIFDGKYLHPVAIEIPHAAWLSQYNVGDTVLAMDDQYCESPVTLTQEIIDSHCYIHFNFAVSN